VFERELLGRLTPDVVVWQFYPNDEWDNVVNATYEIRGGALVPLDTTRNWLYRRNQVYAQIPFREALRQRSYFFRYALRSAERCQWLSAVPRQYPGGSRSWGLAKIGLAVEKMKALGRERGFLTYFVLVAPEALYLDPPEQTREAEGFLRTYERMWTLLSAQPGFIDARFDGAQRRVPARDLFVGSDRDPLGRGGRHFDEDGYRLLAELVLARLTADRAIGAAP
jgi:hypothetical protein